MTTVRMAHSAHSDDAFMLHGLASGAVTSSGLSFVHEVADLESLNHEAVEARYEITALSVHAYAYLQRQYLLLDSGASFGDGYGPIVVVPQGSQLRDLNELTGKRIAVPGKWTSATLALAIRLPLHTQVPMGFARGLDRGQADRFVGMYVNGWTRSAGLKGRKAVALFLGEAAQRGLIPRVKP